MGILYCQQVHIAHYNYGLLIMRFVFVNMTILHICYGYEIVGLRSKSIAEMGTGSPGYWVNNFGRVRSV